MVGFMQVEVQKNIHQGWLSVGRGGCRDSGKLMQRETAHPSCRFMPFLGSVPKRPCLVLPAYYHPMKHSIILLVPHINYLSERWLMLTISVK